MARNSPAPARPAGPIENDLEVARHALPREMHRLFNDIFHGRLHGARQTNSGQREPIMPSIDVSETDGKVRIRAELPGVGDRDIDVPLDGDVLTIRGEKRFEGTDDDKGSYHLVVRSYGKLQRALRLPWPVDPGRVVAAFDNGVLTVTLPKGVEPETSREISQRKAGDLRPDRQSIGRRRRRV